MADQECSGVCAVSEMFSVELVPHQAQCIPEPAPVLEVLVQLSSNARRRWASYSSTCLRYPASNSFPVFQGTHSAASALSVPAFLHTDRRSPTPRAFLPLSPTAPHPRKPLLLPL